MEHTFSGNWITVPAFSDVEPICVFRRQAVEEQPLPQPMPLNQHMLFRQRFTAEKGGRVLLYITADDYYKVYVGGKFVTQGPAPGFHFHYYYNCVDITDFVQAGENVLAVHTYYQGANNRVWVSGDGRCGLLFDVVQDGTVLAGSDESTKCRIHSGFSDLGLTGYRTQFLQRYDSGACEVGFEKPDFDDGDWENAALRKHTDYTLFPQPTKQLELHAVLPAKTEKIPGGWRIDFGRIYVGYLEACAKGKAGDTITLRFGQELEEDGSVRYKLRASCTYEEEWVLSGGADVLSEYDYKSFRYVEILCPEGCEAGDFKMLVRHYPFEAIRTCKYADETLQKIWQLAADSLHYGVQEVIQDCMEREKGQYLGDGCFSSMALAAVTGDTAIMEKLIEDALRTRFINRGLMCCSPCALMQEIAEYPLMLPGALLVHRHLTKDDSFARACFDRVSDVLDYFGEAYGGEDGLLRDLDKWCVVDWPKEARDGYDFALMNSGVSYGLHNVVNAYYIGAIKAQNRLAALLGKSAYRDAVPLEKAFREAFYVEEEGLFKDAEGTTHVSLPGNAFALLFDLCPDTKTEERIVRMIMEKDASRTAFFVSFACLAALTRLGKEEEVIAFIKNPDRWQRMLREGATVTFEAWGKDAKWNTSLFHLCYTYVLLFLTDWGQAEFLEEIKNENH